MENFQYTVKKVGKCIQEPGLLLRIMNRISLYWNRNHSKLFRLVSVARVFLADFVFQFVKLVLV